MKRINFKIKKRAFTLIELIIVISIISILLLVVKVNFVGNKRNLAIEELNTVSETINSIKNAAIIRKKTAVISPNVKDNCIMYKIGDNYKKTYHFRYLKVEDNFDSNIEYLVKFNENGIPANGNSFIFSYNNEKFYIRIRPVTGFVRIDYEKDKK